VDGSVSSGEGVGPVPARPVSPPQRRDEEERRERARERRRRDRRRDRPERQEPGRGSPPEADPGRDDLRGRRVDLRV